jgi:hypothetical protein
MRRLLVLLAVAVGCAKPSVQANPGREIRVLEKGDPALRRIAFAAAEYMKTAAPLSVNLGFRGIYHRRQIDLELSRDVINASALFDALDGDARGGARYLNFQSFGFTGFRVAYDTAYVETVGWSPGANCLVLAVKPDGGWGFAAMKPSARDACGR